jgi:hypothetical protein
MLLLSVWMWERFPVGRPRVLPYQPWEDHGNPLRRPTWAYKWDVVSEFNGDPKRMYMHYTNEFDALNAEQVTIFEASFFASYIESTYQKTLRYGVGGMATIWWEGFFWSMLRVCVEPKVFGGRASLVDAMPVDMLVGGGTPFATSCFYSI